MHSLKHQGAGAVLLQAVTLGMGVAACSSSESRDYCGIRLEASDHACIHGLRGPFDDLVAGWQDQANAPQVERTHVVFRTQLQPLQNGSHAGEVVFTAVRKGIYGVFTNRAVSLEIRHEGGDWFDFAVSTRHTYCDAFAAAHLVALEAEASAVLTITPTSETDVDILFERLGSSLDDLATDECPHDSPAVDASVPQLDAPLMPDAGLGAWDAGEHSEVGFDTGVASDAGSDAGRMPVPPEEPMCRSQGPCSTDAECCAFCHDYDHCH